MKNIIYIASLAFAVLFFGCGKEYIQDVDNLTFRAAADISMTELDRMVVGAYFNISQETGNGGLHDTHLRAYTAMSDNVRFIDNSPFLQQYDIDRYNRNTSINTHSSVLHIWKAGYKVAMGASLAIDHVAKNGVPKEGDTTQIDRILGEAHFLRAFAHFELVRFFAPPYIGHENDRGIILVTEKPGDAFSTNGPSSVKSAYNLIISDLEKAIELLPEEWVSGAHPTSYKSQGRAKKDAAKFLLAKVYFQMGESYWDKALPLMNEVIDGGRYSLAPEPKDNWLLFGDEVSNPEIVWMYVNTSWKTGKNDQLFLLSDAPLVGPTDGADRRACPLSDDFLNASGWADTSEANKDKRYRQLYVYLSPSEDATKTTDFFRELGRDDVWANMYHGYAGWGYQKDGNGERIDLPAADADINTPMFRLGELMALRGVIYAKTGNGDPAPDLNTLRTRAGIDTKPSYTFEEAKTEHRVETAFEGRRINFLKALAEPIPPGDRSSGPLDYDSPYLYWSIPQIELERNGDW